MTNGRSDEEVGRVQFKGLDDLHISDDDLRQMRELVEKFSSRLHMRVHNEFLIEVRVKEHQKTGSQHRYEIKSKFSYPGATLAAEESDWDPVLALRGTLEALESRVESRHRNAAGPEPRQYSGAASTDQKTEDDLRYLRGQQPR